MKNLVFLILNKELPTNQEMTSTQYSFQELLYNPDSKPTPMTGILEAPDSTSEMWIVRDVSVPGQNINFHGLNRDEEHPMDCFAGALATAGLITDQVYRWLVQISLDRGIPWNQMFNIISQIRNTGGEIGHESCIAEPHYSALDVLSNFIPVRNDTYILTLLQLEPININHVVLVKNNATEGLTLIDSQRQQGKRIFQGNLKVAEYLNENVYMHNNSVTRIFIIKERIDLSEMMGLLIT